AADRPGSCRIFELRGDPASREAQLAPERRRREAGDPGELGAREASEVVQLHDARLAFVGAGQVVQQRVEFEQLHGILLLAVGIGLRPRLAACLRRAWSTSTRRIAVETRLTKCWRSFSGIARPDRRR